MREAVSHAALVAAVLLGAACGGANASRRSLRPMVDVDSYADRARLRAALGALERRVGHPVDFAIDEALVEGSGKEHLILADTVEGFLGLLVRFDPSSSAHCRPITSCAAFYQLDMAIDAYRMLAPLRSVELRYDVLAEGKKPHYELASGRLVFALTAEWSPSIDWREASDAIVAATLAAQFAGRSAPAVAPGELAQYVWAEMHDPDDARSVIELAAVYPRLSDPARLVARDALVSFTFDTRKPDANTPAVRAAWTMWYRAFADSLPEESLRRAADNVFPPLESGTIGVAPPEELAGLPAFDYAWSLFDHQVHGRPSAESAVLTCVKPYPCGTALYRYFSDRQGIHRREHLVQALVAAHDPALTTYALSRLFQERDGRGVRGEILQAMTRDPASYGAALEAAMLAADSPDGDVLVATWRKWPALRPAILRAAASTGQTASSFSAEEARSIVGYVRSALESMARDLCLGDQAGEFAQLYRAAITPNNPVFIGTPASATSKEGVCSGYRRD